MLLRRLQEFITRTPDKDSWFDKVVSAKRFVFAGTAALACKQIALYPTSLEAARPHLIAPFQNVWIEIGDDMGYLWWGEGGNVLRQGVIMSFYWPAAALVPKHNIIRVDLDHEIPGKVGETMDFLKGIKDRATNLARTEPLAAQVLDYILDDKELDESASNSTHWLMASWALLSSKTLLDKPREVEYSKLNLQRAKKGLPALLDYSEIRLNLDACEAVKAHLSGPQSGMMRQHSVRGHLRMLPSAKIALVRPHMRGNPDRGSVHKDYVVSGGDSIIARSAFDAST